MIKQLKNWFTLVELIVVITILAILWTIGFLSLQWYSSTSRNSVRLSNIWSMKTWLELFHLQAWKYPDPTDGTWVTYGWWTVWTQWTFWDSVILNIPSLNNKPIDPLSEVEYAYSVLTWKQEFELAWSMEWDLIAWNIIWWVNASWTRVWTAYSAWNYNAQVAKAEEWWTTYVLALPSIITSDLSTPTLEDIVTNNELVYKWYNNLPSTYSGTSFNVTSNITVNLTDTLVVFSWSWTPTSYPEISTLLTNLKQAYAWSDLSDNENYDNLVTMDTTDSTVIANMWKKIVSEKLWWKIDFLASGWTITQTSSHIIHTFATTWTWTFEVVEGEKDLEVLVVAGWWGWWYWVAWAWWWWWVVYNSVFPVSVKEYEVIVWAWWWAGGYWWGYLPPTPGKDSKIGNLRAKWWWTGSQPDNSPASEGWWSGWWGTATYGPWQWTSWQWYAWGTGTGAYWGWWGWAWWIWTDATATEWWDWWTWVTYSISGVSVCYAWWWWWKGPEWQGACWGGASSDVMWGRRNWLANTGWGWWWWAQWSGWSWIVIVKYLK